MFGIIFGFEVDPKGSSVLTGFEDGVVRVLNVQKIDGIDQHGRKLTDKSELVLKQALKPHKSRVTSMAIDSRGEVLATGVSSRLVLFEMLMYNCVGLTLAVL